MAVLYGVLIGGGGVGRDNKVVKKEVNGGKEEVNRVLVLKEGVFGWGMGDV